jgi:hypothetical protein
MPQARVVNTSRHIASEVIARDSDCLFFAVLEANYNDVRAYRPGRLNELLRPVDGFCSGLSAWTTELPIRVAEYLSESADGYMYAGVLVVPKIVSICTAGDIRVHAIGGRGIQFVSRLHNLVEDPVDDERAEMSEEAGRRSLRVVWDAPHRHRRNCGHYRGFGMNRSQSCRPSFTVTNLLCRI